MKVNKEQRSTELRKKQDEPADKEPREYLGTKMQGCIKKTTRTRMPKWNPIHSSSLGLSTLVTKQIIRDYHTKFSSDRHNFSRFFRKQRRISSLESSFLCGCIR